MRPGMSIQLSTEQLQTLVDSLAWNDGFGCYTRAGFEKLVWPEIAHQAKWIIYFDVDGMHDLNEAFGGYEQVDAMIKEALSILRSTDFVAGQWKSGDEFLVCITDLNRGPHEESIPMGLVDRLKAALALQGLSATFAVVQVTSKDLAANVKAAVDMVYGAKKSGRRGSVQG
jgi:GGDEF domain-containing protein